MEETSTNSADERWKHFYTIITELQGLKEQVENLKQQAGMSRDLLEPIPNDLIISTEQVLELHRRLNPLVKLYLEIVKSTPAVYPCPAQLSREQWKYKDLQGSGLYCVLSFQRAVTYRKEGRPIFPLPKITEDLLRRWKFNWQTDGMTYRRMIARRIEYNMTIKSKLRKQALDVREEEYCFRESEAKSPTLEIWENRIKTCIGPQHHWLFDDNIMPDLEWMCLIYHVGKLMEEENQFRKRIDRWQALDRHIKGRLREEAMRTEMGNHLLSLSRLWGNQELQKTVDEYVMLGQQQTYDSAFGDILVDLVEEVMKANFLEWALNRAGSLVKVPLESTLTRIILNRIKTLKGYFGSSLGVDKTESRRNLLK